jgi:hypothetical protein
VNRGKLTAVRAPILKAAQFAFGLLLSILLMLPLVSVIRHANVALAFKALLGALLVLSAARPAAGVLALAVLLPLALAIQSLLGPQPTGSVITEALVLAFGAGAALRLTAATPDGRGRLARPALVLGLIFVSSAIVALVAEQAASPGRDIAADLWRQLNGRFLFVNRPFSYVHGTFRWIGLLALAVFVERALRRSPALAPVVTRMFLVGGAAAASFAALRLATLLIEGRIASDRLEILGYIIREVRITALHADPNAAGSYFALFLVPAIVVGVRQRNAWMLCAVAPLIGLAFLLAQSRAALLAIGVIPGVMAVAALVKARRYALAVAVVLAVPVLGLAARIVTGPSHAPLARAAIIRQEMAHVAVDMARDHPAFGVGVGRYAAMSRYYINDDTPVLSRWSPLGQNAHNNFLQILAELGVPAFCAFLWLVLPTARRWPWEPPNAPERVVYASALAAGLATFLLTAVFGHPLLIVQVAAAFFLALGLTSALLPPPSGAGTIGRGVAGFMIAVVVIALPWRVIDARAGAADQTGVSEVAGTLDGVPYRTAEPVSAWQVPADVAVISLPLRWEAPAPSGCTVDVVFDGRVADRARPDTIVWMPLRFRLPPSSTPTGARVLELRVSDPACQLLVGPFEALD